FADPLTTLAAGRLIRLFRSVDRWCSFSDGMLERFYERMGCEEPHRALYGLLNNYYDGTWVEAEHRYIFHTRSGMLQVTNLFVHQCSLNLKKKQSA
ncbi:MAG: hypothetical protein V4436_03375, partial [Patescibacteria group bacterium]